ncbi:tumor necrosis factor receptor superfamily member 25 [Elysia marginata]|uniref:Tumor necrosis factor receptor superfamily member 25 n=1 Tax=Elysia marginata TaxID=1093978 RepID=A0AAV4JRD5_9GAST|nr:tumor necrosis factor receptor superfamily member 25 [Elysia marginata]
MVPFLFLTQVALLAVGVTLVSGTCGLGTFQETDASGLNKCRPCPNGTFNDEENHTRSSCSPCLLVDHQSRYYIVISDCSPISNAKISCIENFYFADKFSDATCQICTNCTLLGKFVKQPCQTKQDTICCPEKGVDCRGAVPSNESPLERQVQRKKCIAKNLENQSFTFRSSEGCLDRESYVCDVGNKTVACTPCDRGTYMNESRHFNPACRPYADVPPNNVLPADHGSYKRITEDYVVLIGLAAAIVLVVVLVVGWVVYRKCTNKKKPYTVKEESEEESVAMT